MHCDMECILPPALTALVEIEDRPTQCVTNRLSTAQLQDYLQRLFTIQPAPGHSGALVDAGTPVNIIGAGMAKRARLLQQVSDVAQP